MRQPAGRKGFNILNLQTHTHILRRIWLPIHYNINETNWNTRVLTLSQIWRILITKSNFPNIIFKPLMFEIISKLHCLNLILTTHLYETYFIIITDKKFVQFYNLLELFIISNNLNLLVQNYIYTHTHANINR